MLDVEKLIDGIHDYLGRALTPLSARLKALEDRPFPERGEKGQDGRDGKDADPVIIADLVKHAVDPEFIKSAVERSISDIVSGLTRRFEDSAHG